VSAGVAGTSRAFLERRALKLAQRLGNTAVPLLSRKLREDGDAEASLAYFLLARVGGARAVDVARSLALDAAAPDQKKALALALLSELGAEIPEAVELRDASKLRRESVHELVATLSAPADVARAADLLILQVSPVELPVFMADMLEEAGTSLLPLLAELLLRDDLDDAVHGPLEHLYAEARAKGRPSLSPRLAPRRGRTTVYAGARHDGRTLLAALRSTGRGQPLRALVLYLAPSEQLCAARYGSGVARETGIRRLLMELAQEGYVLSPTTVAKAASAVGAAARAAVRASMKLPRDYYLGRDILGLTDEHRDDRVDTTRSTPRPSALSAHSPDDATARSLLGTALLSLGKHEEALLELHAAARLEPSVAERHWNLAHAARKAGKLGACYLALVDYLGARDRARGAAERGRAARRYVRLFSRYARAEHPDAKVEHVARAEELFERAYRHLVEERLSDAISGFQAVLKLCPSHYPSWGNLGAAYVSLGERDRAEECLRKALDYCPSYEIARQNLSALED
jgi:tetratricopeptide (TPR) repeat protein